MRIIPANDFRANMERYFHIAETEPIYVKRDGETTLCISQANELPIEAKEDNNPDWLTPEIMADIEEGEREIKEGRYVVVHANESMSDFLKKLVNNEI